MQEENRAETPMQGSEFEGHTPGEWFVTENPSHLAEGYCIPDIKATHPDYGYSLDIATCYGSGLPDENNRANARIIAAAPRLLRERDEARAELAKVKAERDQLLGDLQSVTDLLSSTEAFASNLNCHAEPAHKQDNDSYLRTVRTTIIVIRALLSRLNKQGGDA